MMLSPDLQTIANLGNSAILVIVAWRVIRAINRVMDVLKDYPPHRHINGSILFPDGFQPTPVQRLDGGRGNS
jgi:hypothetical protein